MEKNYLFQVTTIKSLGDEEHRGIPEGSVIYVEEELKDDYFGTWSCMGGSIHVTIPKDICVRLENIVQKELFED